jgi:hypothetical protein
MVDVAGGALVEGKPSRRTHRDHFEGKTHEFLSSGRVTSRRGNGRKTGLLPSCRQYDRDHRLAAKRNKCLVSPPTAPPPGNLAHCVRPKLHLCRTERNTTGFPDVEP